MYVLFAISYSSNFILSFVAVCLIFVGWCDSAIRYMTLYGTICTWLYNVVLYTCRRVLGDGHGGHVHPPRIFNLGNCNCNVCKYALKFKKGCKQIIPSAPVHPPSWGAEHAPVHVHGIHGRVLYESRIPLSLLHTGIHVKCIQFSVEIVLVFSLAFVFFSARPHTFC